MGSSQQRATPTIHAGSVWEVGLLGVAVFWCGWHSPFFWQLAALFAASSLTALLMPRATVYCRPGVGDGLSLGAMVLPLLFVSRAGDHVAIAQAFKLTWWAGLLACGERVWSARDAWRGVCGAAVAMALVMGAMGIVRQDQMLIPALVAFCLCIRCIQAAMPQSFSFGEALVASELCTVLSHFMLFSVMLDVVPLLVLHSKLRKIMAIGLFSSMAISSLNLLLSGMLKSVASLEGIRARRRGFLHWSLSLGCVPIMLQCMTWSIGESTLVWLWNYLSSHTATPLKFCVYYVLVLIPGVILAPASARGSVKQIIVRKYFHVLALAMFVPTILINIKWMALAFAVGISFFIVIESLRISDVPGLADTVNEFFRHYRDDRDTGQAVLTHLYLLLGCALPVFFSYFVMRGIFSATSLLIALSGMAVTGLGDAVASYVGINYGKHKWSGSKKTYEGTIGMALAVFIFQANCLSIKGYHGLSLASWARLAIADVLVALLEARTDQIDNLFLPLYHVAILQMV